MEFLVTPHQDLHKDTAVSIGNEINLLSSRDLKMYSLHNDQSIFDPVRKFPMQI